MDKCNRGACVPLIDCTRYYKRLSAFLQQFTLIYGLFTLFVNFYSYAQLNFQTFFYINLHF